MQDYTLEFILTEESQYHIKEYTRPIAKKVQSIGGKATSVHCYGIRTLLFPIKMAGKAHERGIQCRINLQLPKKKTVEPISNALDLNPHVLRYLLYKSEKLTI